jgi:hypothetical protein
MTEKKRFIEASIELQEEIAKTYEVTVRTVRSALSFATNSPSARLFRAYALNHGATLYEEKENPYKRCKSDPVNDKNRNYEGN